MAKLIVQQQDMSVGTLAQLRARGVIENSTLLRLDFHYMAPGRAQADDLAEFLRTSTDYDVHVARTPHGGIRRGWTVNGTTQDTEVSGDIIDQWIRWMVMAGAQHGECRFDGWGALAPS